ncbi:MAG: DUF6603 domain-containing protein [Elainellaceae cyanobacterium]
MNAQPGTIEVLALELSRVLDPLRRYFLEGNAKSFFAQMGIPITDAQESTLSTPLQVTVTKTDELIQLSIDLVTALNGGDDADITNKAFEVAAKIVDVVNSFDTLASAISGLSLPDLPPAITDEIPSRIFNLLLVDYFDQIGGLNEVLELLGILERVVHNENSTDPNDPPYTISTFHFDKIGTWLTSPGDELATLYDWGVPTFDGTLLLRRLENLFAHLGLPVFFDTLTTPPKLDIILVEILPKIDVNPKGLAIALKTNLSSGAQNFSQEDWQLAFKSDFQSPFNTQLIVQPNGSLSILAPAGVGEVSGELDSKFTVRRTTPTEPFLILGQVGGSRLSVNEFFLGIGTFIVWDASNNQGNGEFNLESGARQGKVVIDISSGDGFLSKILAGSRIETEFDLTVGVSSKTGFYFTGSSTLEIQLPVHVSLGPAELKNLTIALKIQTEKFPVDIGTDLKAELGPLVAVVQNMGVTTELSFPPGGGNLGPLNLNLGFKPPMGVGLAVDASVVEGGGFLRFDPDKEQYDGILELNLKGIVSVKAIGLITTRLPDGSKGFSLLIIITAEFGTGLQLGFGFVLLGVGGLLGLNRTMKLQPLTEGVRTGATESVLFPQNIIANAPRIISDLRRFFPPEDGIFLIGPMAKLGWGTPALITLSLGIIFEIPGNIAILGVLKVVLPDERAALLVLQVNFIGAIEFDKQRVYFFATLFESRILFNTIEGGMGVLMAWGNDSNFVVSVGGFHPQFTPPPLPFPTPQRIAVTIVNQPLSRIRVMAYFAVTSNTVQFGARAEIFFGFSKFKLEGHLAFDALFQFSPFFFIIEISCEVSLKVFGIGLFSISLKFSLEGPTPWRAKGYGKLKLLFFSIKANFDFTWGETKDTSLPPIDVLPLLQAEFEKLSNWKAQLPASSNLLVSLRMLSDSSDRLVLHPIGTLTVTQRAVPLDLRLDKVGNQKPKDGKRFYLDVTSGLKKVADLDEQFAIAQFQDFKDAEKLSQAPFQPEEAGIEVAVSDQSFATGKAVKRNIRYETHIIDTNFQFLFIALFGFVNRLFNHFLNGSVVTKSVVSQHYKRQFQPFDDTIVLKPEQFVVASTVDNRAVSQQAVFTSEAKARDFMDAEVARDASRRELLHVIPSDEVNVGE